MKFIFTCSIIIVSVISIRAQIFVKHDATGANNGSSWTNAFTDLQSAIDASNSGGQIWITSGTYVPVGPSPDSSHFILKKGLELYGGFAGTESSLEERNWQTNLTILSGDKNGDDVEGEFFNWRLDNAHHILIVDAGSIETILDGLTFISGTTRLDGFAPDSSDILGYDRWRGGAIFIQNTPALIRNCLFQDNFGYEGSGVFARNPDQRSNTLVIENTTFQLNGDQLSAACSIWPWSSCEIRNCDFKNNQSGSYGAALVILNADATLSDCSFEDNFASSAGGACLMGTTQISLNPHPSYAFDRCQFTGNNTAIVGGAILVECYSFGFDLTFDSCFFLNNYTLSNGSYGGALYVGDYKDAELTEVSNQVKLKDCMFQENSSNYGGAFEIDGYDDSLNIHIQGSQFINNSCFNTNGEAGAFYIWQQQIAKTITTVENSMFSRNSSNGYAGGVTFAAYSNAYAQSYLLKNCTFNENESVKWGGAFATYASNGSASVGTIQNSRFTNNISSLGGAIASAGDTLIIDKCDFIGNQTIGPDPNLTGAGAIHCFRQGTALITNSTFSQNSSESESGAITMNSDVNSRIENVLFKENTGNGAIHNWGNMILLNITMANNASGLVIQDSSQTEIQNSVFENEFSNIYVSGTPTIISKGGNISSDATMESYLSGFGPYADLHNTDPKLKIDLSPDADSPCIDAGNPDGITSTYDLAGNPRIQGAGIDIGSYESFLVAVKDAIWDASILNVYPNPVKDVLNFNLESDWTGEMRVIIYNNLGQPVDKAPMTKSSRIQSFTENLNYLNPGEYVVLVELGKTIYATNIIIQR